jgi:hypothetical protein
MNIDDGDSENIVIQDSEDGGGNTGARTAGSGGRRRDPDSAYVPDPDAEKEDLDDNQGYTRITRGKARSVSSPMNTRVLKKAAPTRAFIRISEPERRMASEAPQTDQMVALRGLVETLCKQVQEMRAKQESTEKAQHAKIDELQKLVERQNRTLEALHALSEESVRKPTYSEAVQAGTVQPREAQKVTVSSSPKESSVPQTVRYDERAVSIDTGRSKVSTTDFSDIKEKLQQGIDKAGATKGLKIQFLRPGPGERIEVIFENKAQAEKARKHTYWATGQFRGTRVQGEKWYPVKCDMVAKQAVLDRSMADDKTLSQTVCQNFSKDNQAEGIDFTATKVHWLSKTDYKKKVGSLVIWLKSKFAADHLLSTGTAIFGATGAYCSKWELREKELPCFNCNRYGHKQAECKSKIRCALCSREHSRHNCPKDTLKCPSCGADGHSVMDWQCPHHPNNWKYVGKQRAMLSKGSNEPGTTRISQEIIAKRNASNTANTPKSSQEIGVMPDNTRTITPRTTQATPKSTQVTPARSRTDLRQHGQPQTARQGGTTGDQSEREIEMIDVDSDEPFDE